tara:strand:- start:658 stop:4383 length:3726 start_codon:yes stop_codon:yes gene_type:complete
MAFKKFRHSNIKGEKGSDWNIEIWKSGFSGSSTEFEMEGEGFEITWNGQGGTRKEVFLGSACTINFLVLNDDDEAFTYDTIAQGFKYYYVRIYRGAVADANLWWFGWLQPSFDVIENAPYPYSYKLTASDSYGYINKLKSKFFTSNITKNGIRSFLSTFQKTLARDNDISYISDADVGGSTTDNLTPNPDNRKFIRTVSNWWRDGETYSTTVDPLTKVFFSPGAYAKKTQFQTDEFGNVTATNLENSLEYKEQDVFNGSLRIFNLVGFLAEGFYNFIQPNTYIGNNSATLNAFESFNSTFGVVQNTISSTLLTIDQTTNVILGGSTLTFEPSLESVSLTHDQVEQSFLIVPETNLENIDVTAGVLAISTGVYNFDFIVQNDIRVLKAGFSGGTGNNVTSNTYLNTCIITIKLSNGTTDYYLQTDGATNPKLKWTASGTPLTIEVKRGYAASEFASNNPLNNSNVVNTGSPVENNGSSTLTFGSVPCSKYNFDNITSGFRTLINFKCQVDEAPITGTVTIKTTTTNDYSQFLGGEVVQINNPTPTYNRTKVLMVGTTAIEQNNFTNASGSITYSSSQTATPSLESVDLGNVPIGQENVVQNALYSVKHLVGSQFTPITTGFRRGDTGDFSKLLQLVTNEYLEMQTKPLEILQADIQSPTISPLKIINYSINGDGNSKQYKFLGGTFKAQSEILSGEWYKVAESGASITDDSPTQTTAFQFNPGNNLLNQLSNFTALNNKKINQVISDDKFGVIDTNLPAGVATTTISLAANLTGAINDNQFFKITYPDGSNSASLKSNANHTTSDDTLTIDSFTPTVTYFSGCLIKPNTTRVINQLNSITISDVSANRMTTKGTPGETGGAGPNATGAVHTISDGFAYIHTQDIGDLSSGIYSSLGVRLYSGMGQGVTFDSSGDSVPSDSNDRNTGAINIQSGDLEQDGSGDISTGSILINTGDADQDGSGDSTTGNLNIRAGISTAIGGDSQGGSVIIQPGTASSSSGTATKGSVQIGLADYVTNILGTLTVADLDITGSSNALTISSTTGNVAINASSTDADCIIRVADNSTAGTNVIGMVATSDDLVMRNDEGSFKVNVANNATTALELTQAGKLNLLGNLIETGVTEVKILPSDFIADDGGRPLAIDDGTTNRRWLESFSTNPMFASVKIPFGKKAIRVEIYGSGTSAMVVYEANINTNVVTSKGTGNIGTPLTITNVNYSTTNYILIQLAQASGEEVYGGKLIIQNI